MLALAQNNCGPQYAAAARNSGNFFDNLFGNNNADNNNPIPPVDSGVQSGTYRTVCVRSCDGFYFPISFATVPSRFPDDERTCKSLCPAADASLYAYRNPGEDMNQAVSISGQPYSSLPNAFHYRQEFNPSCSCKPAGETWSEALKGLDDKATAVQQGDIIVTEENAKKMATAARRRSREEGQCARERRSRSRCSDTGEGQSGLEPRTRRTTTRASAPSGRRSSRRGSPDRQRLAGR